MEKTYKRFEKISFKILVAILVANVTLTIINLYLTVQFNQTLINLRLQGSIPNSVFTIMANTGDTNLGEPIAYVIENGTLKTIHSGTLYAVIQVVTSHYCAVTVKLKSFNITSSKYLSSEKINETKIFFADKKPYVYLLAPGTNQINAQIHLKAKVALDPENLPSEGESLQFSLGYLFLEAEAFDFENQTRVVSEFSSEIFITIDAPDF